MRTITTMRRIGALAAACFAASALAASAASAAADKPLIATASGSSIKAVGRTFDVGTSSRANCPDDVGPQGCVVQTTMLAVVTPVGKTPHLALVARGKTGMDPGTSERIVVRLTAVGAQELRLRGRVDGRLHLRVTEQTVPHSPNPDTVIDLTRLQSFTVPPLVLTDATRLSRVTLAPGQRLVLRLRGENASTGYGWKVDPLAQNSPMLLLSTRSILSPSCTRGMVGCFSVREVVYQSGGLGVTTISAGLYGPQAETDATVRVTLRVATTSGGNSPPLVYTAKDNGSSSTRRTPRFIVRLRGASGSTGYAWRPIVDGAATLSPVVHEMITDDCAVGMVGCAETDEFTYLSPRSGPATLRLGLYAPGNPTPVEQFTFSLVEPEVLP